MARTAEMSKINALLLRYIVNFSKDDIFCDPTGGVLHAALVCRPFPFSYRQAKTGMRFKSSFDTKQQSERWTSYLKDDEDVLMDEADDVQFWAPHPKTGIYFPRGHERVMEDIPQGAACLNKTYWVRNTDDVEHPEPDGPSS